MVKNVTGYDLCKLMAGSFGTLALLTEVTVKVMPRPETACTLLLPGLSDETAIPLMAGALNSPHEISGAAHLPTAAAQRLGFAESALTALRLEGPAPSIAFRVEALVNAFGSGPRLDAAETAKRSGARSATSRRCRRRTGAWSGGSARRRARRRR